MLLHKIGELMKSWKNKFLSLFNVLSIGLVLSATEAFGAGDLKSSITTALDSAILSTLISGAALVLGALEAFNIWKAMFNGGDSNLWTSVIKLLGWIIFAIYWKTMLISLMGAFAGI
jgi:hypothetical protein